MDSFVAGTLLTKPSMLGLVRIQCSRMSSTGDTITSLYGHAGMDTSYRVKAGRAVIDLLSTETEKSEEEHDQLPLITNVPEHCWTEKEEVNSRRLDKIIKQALHGLDGVRGE